MLDRGLVHGGVRPTKPFEHRQIRRLQRLHDVGGEPGPIDRVDACEQILLARERLPLLRREAIGNALLDLCMMRVCVSTCVRARYAHAKRR